MLFVIWVISAWAIRTRCAELQLLFIKNLSIEVETHVSDDDHSTTVAGVCMRSKCSANARRPASIRYRLLSVFAAVDCACIRQWYSTAGT